MEGILHVRQPKMTSTMHFSTIKEMKKYVKETKFSERYSLRKWGLEYLLYPTRMRRMSSNDIMG